MGLDIREWMLLAGGVLFLAVVIDGVRRVLSDRKEEVRLSKRAKKGFPPLDNENEEPKNSELLSRARVLARNANAMVSNETDAYEKQAQNEDVPVLLNTVSQDEIDHLDLVPEDETDQTSEPAHEQVALPLDIPETAEDLIETESTTSDALATEPETNSEPLGEVEQVVVINVHAQQGEVFNGKEMLETLLNHDVRFGTMEIFHKRESLDDSKRVQFSIANSVEPGTFTLDEFETFSTPGVTFFMQLPGPKKPMEAFKAMLAVADALSSSTGGAMLDEQRNPISQQTLEHMKQQVEDFERRSLAKRAQ